MGGPTSYEISKGLFAAANVYGYDTRNRLTAIEYKDGTTVLDGFYYELDDTGNITKTTNEDDSYWDYTYDDRYRLLTANRFNSTGHVKAAYSYTYDDGDNMLTKIEPFLDDFDDGNVTGWSQWTGTWSGSSTRNVSRYPAKRGKPGDAGGFAARQPPENTSSGSAWVMRANTDADLGMSFRYLSEDTSNNGYYVSVYPRYVDTSNRVILYILPNKVTLSQVSSGTYSVLDEDTGVTTAQDTWYDYRVVCDGANIEVWRSTGTAMPVKVLETSSCSVTSTANIGAVATANSYHEFDDIRILSDSVPNTTTFAVNTANELTSMAATPDSSTLGSATTTRTREGGHRVILSPVLPDRCTDPSVDRRICQNCPDLRNALMPSVMTAPTTSPAASGPNSWMTRPLSCAQVMMAMVSSSPSPTASGPPTWRPSALRQNAMRPSP